MRDRIITTIIAGGVLVVMLLWLAAMTALALAALVWAWRVVF